MQYVNKMAATMNHCTKVIAVVPVGCFLDIARGDQQVKHCMLVKACIMNGPQLPSWRIVELVRYLLSHLTWGFKEKNSLRFGRGRPDAYNVYIPLDAG